MKTYYIAAAYDCGGKYIASVFACSENDNLVSLIGKTIISANICPTKAKAYEVANLWNEGFKRDGIYHDITKYI